MNPHAMARGGREGRAVDRDEFSRRILEMRPTLYRVSYGMLSSPVDRDDAVQSAILKAWQKQDALRDEGAMNSWVVRILINECYDILREHKRTRPVAEFSERTAPPGADRELHDAILALEEKLRLPVILHYMEGYRVEEMARMLRLPQGTVKSRLRRARMRLKDMLDDEGGDRDA